MNFNISAVNQNDGKPQSAVKQLLEGLSAWLGLSLRTQLEHDRIVLQIPVGAMRWTAASYQEEAHQLNNQGCLEIDVSGISLKLSFTLSHEMDLTAMKKLERVIHGEEPHTDILVEGAVLAPNDLRELMVWLIQALRPTEFIVQSA